MTKKLVFANLIGNDFNNLPFDINNYPDSVEFQKFYGLSRTDKVTTQFEYSLAKLLKKGLNILKSDLNRASLDPNFRKVFTRTVVTRYRLCNYRKFSNGQKLFEKQCRNVLPTWLAIMLFDEDVVCIAYFTSIYGSPVLSHQLYISDIKRFMRKNKLEEIFP